MSVPAALFGTSSASSFIESAIGIAVGARTGLAAVVTGVIYLSAILLAPLYLLVPPEATGPLVFMTCLVFAPLIARLDVDSPVELLPALFVAFFIPYSGMVAIGTAIG
jgi:AGZA family xanthine/uracil permease-like MFS transporter